MEDYSTLSGIYDFVQQVARYGEIPPRCVIDDFVQQVARYGKIPPQCVIDDFVQQVARYDSFIFKAFDSARFTACADNRLI